MKEVDQSYKNIKNHELFIKYNENKSIEIRNEIFDKYKYIVEIVSKKYRNKGIDEDDIYQIACLALIYAIERYDITKGFEFTSFATPTIFGEIKKYFRDKGWAIKVPRKIQEISKLVSEANLRLNNTLQRNPTVKEIALCLDIGEEEILESIEASKMYNSQSLDLSYETSEDENDIFLIDLLGYEDSYFEQIENSDFIKKSLNKLNKLERDIIESRYFKSMTQSEIAKKLNISQMTVSRIEKKILEKLRIESER